MTVEIERALRRKCEDDERLRLLLAQWEYDQRLVGQALQAVATTFPHYSLHDASHSNSILVQITRVLGQDRIDRLSATDLWLILEAAYWHDLGMVVDDETLRGWWQDATFRHHLADLKSSQDPVLARAAEIVSAETGQALNDPSWPLWVRRAVTLVVADFARTRHAEQSRELVSHPLAIGLSSPRAVIPERLFHWLGSIAAAHGRTREHSMLIPHSECGMGNEACHPRFVAFLLRLGDLLDLDNGRFCPVLTRSFGSMPPSSLDHVGKHAAIRRFHVSPQRIEVEAVCREQREIASDPYGAYEAVSAWLGWLRDEIQFLSSRWSDIAPEDAGGAPSLGRIEATLEDYIALEAGKRPEFKVDVASFLGLIRSNNLYREQFAWLREVIANADDATRIRVFAENRDRIDALVKTQPRRGPFDLFEGFVQGRGITVRLSEALNVSIEDHGTGISREDLRYMLTIGSSKKNPERQRMIREMPGVLCPTGSFGIGLQSVFMVTDQVDIATMHYRTRDRLHIRILRRVAEANGSPESEAGIEREGVYIRELEPNEPPLEPGTIVRFQCTRGVESIEETESTTGAMFADDPVAASTSVLERMRLTVGELERDFLTPLVLEGKEDKKAERTDERVRVFDHATDCYLKFDRTEMSANLIEVDYRGAPVLFHPLESVGLLRVAFGIHSGSASDLLTASRDSFTHEGEEKVKGWFWQALGNVYESYLQELAGRLERAQTPSSDPNQSAPLAVDEHNDFARASLFALVYLNGQGDMPRVQLTGDRWRQVELLSDDSGRYIKLGELGDKYGLEIPTASQSALADGRGDRVQNWYSLRSLDVSYNRWIRDTLLALYPSSEFLGVFSGASGPVRRYVLSGTAAPIVGDAAFEQVFRDELSFAHPLKRPILPGHATYKALHIDPCRLDLPTWVNAHQWIVPKVILSPLEILSDGERLEVTARHLREYEDWVIEFCEPTSDNEQRRRESIREAVLEFAGQLMRFAPMPPRVWQERRPFGLEEVERRVPPRPSGRTASGI